MESRQSPAECGPNYRAVRCLRGRSPDECGPTMQRCRAVRCRNGGVSCQVKTRRSPAECGPNYRAVRCLRGRSPDECGPISRVKAVSEWRRLRPGRRREDTEACPRHAHMAQGAAAICSRTSPVRMAVKIRGCDPHVLPGSAWWCQGGRRHGNYALVLKKDMRRRPPGRRAEGYVYPLRY